MQLARLARRHKFWERKSDREVAYVKSNLDFAEHDSQQGHGDHGSCGNADEHADHEYDLFHHQSPLQVLIA